MRVDAHHHLWHYNAEEFGWLTDDMAALRRDFLPPNLEAVAAPAGVDVAVAVQARCSLDETRFLLRCAAQSKLIAKVVGWAPLASPALAGALAEFAGEANLAGFREIAQDQPAGSFLAPAFNDGVRQLTAQGYTYDILIRAHQIEEATQLVDLHPRQRFVLDHAGKPPLKAEQIEPWRTQLSRLAERPNVFCKLSGLVTEGDWHHWTDAQVEPYLDACLEAFGPSRCMAGSDWPVCLVATEYGRWWQLLERWAARLTEWERERILGLNAAAFYGIETAAAPASEVRR